MNILLLGNGFDINYQLPTKYINFLRTITYLGKCGDEVPSTAGAVFGAPELQSIDKDIAKSYQEYAKYYDMAHIDRTVIEKLKKTGRSNIWFNYLSQLVNKDIGWIDFEKEISSVLDAFEAFLKHGRIRYNIAMFSNDPVACKIIDLFNFFSEENRYATATHRVLDEFVITNPIATQIKQINQGKIVEYLEQSLLEFADGLKEYLRCFVDNVVSTMSKLSVLPTIQAFELTDSVITFNYTKTYEYVYGQAKVFHIHGDVNSRIVLGINPNDADRIGTIDTTFLPFKKYYQRTVYHSEDEYLSWMTDQAKYKGTAQEDDISLLVMGHSLDITDKDMLVELFDMAKSITILYHSDSSQRSLALNLVKMYGKDGFHELRTKKNLRFLSLSADFTDFLEERKKTYKTATERFLNNWLY